MPVEKWREQYADLFMAAAEALNGVSDLDLTAEMITHRFTPKSKLVQLDWYPKTKLDLDESSRAKKRTKFGSSKFVYPSGVTAEMRDWFSSALRDYLPQAQLLYWT